MQDSNQSETEDRIRIGDKIQIRRRGKRGIWIAEFWHDGDHRKRSLKTANKEIARKRAIQLEADLANGEYTQRPRAMGLQQAVDEYIGVKRGDGCRHKTIVKYEQRLNDFVEFAASQDARLVQQLTVKLYEQYRAARITTLSQKTVYNGLIIVKQFVSWCSGRGRNYLPKNPLIGVQLRKPAARPAYVPSTDQVRQLLEGASGERRLQYAVLAMTGLRAGELTMLRPRDVDLAGGWIHVSAREDWTPKTGQSRTVPIHPKLREMLEPTAASRKNQPYFFCSSPSPKYPKGDHFINQKHMLEDFHKLAMKLELPVGRKNGGIVIHSLRHYFKTTAVDSAVPNYVTDAWMGHSDGSMGRQYYSLPAEKQQTYMQQVQF